MSDWSGISSVAITRAGLEIRHYTFWAEPYPVGGLWGVSFSGYVFNVTDAVVDSVTAHAKLNVTDTMTWVVADSLNPADSARFGFSQMVMGEPEMQALWADFR